MLELKNINISLLQDNRKIIENFNFTLGRGDKAVIIGEEGNGKSTLLKMIYDRSLIANYCQSSGNILCKGILAYLPQMMDEQFLGMTVAEYFADLDAGEYAEGLRHLGIPAALIRSEQIVGTLSGGEKVKIQLAKLLAAQPDVLLLDEPTNDIDLETLEWLERFIKSANIPILYVSHDETLIENTANVIIHLEQLIRKTVPRATVARMKYSDYITARLNAFDKQMQVALNQRSEHRAQMERWQQIYNRVEHEQNTISRQDPAGGRLLKKKMKSVKSQEKRLEREKEDFLEIPETEEAVLVKFDPAIMLPRGKVVLDFTLDKLTVANRILAENISLRVNGNEHIGIVGRNGAGKSTLLTLIWAELQDRRDITAAYMPQSYAEKLDYNLTPIAFLAERYTKEEITKARTFMGSMRFTKEEMMGKIGELSGGQKAKLLFLDMVLQQANVLVLDEPTRNFSPLSNPVIRNTLKEFGGAIISISHDRKYLNEVCVKVYELTQNGLVLTV